MRSISFNFAPALILALTLACGSDTDTSVSTASTTTITGASSTGPVATTGDATGFVTTGADELTTGGQGATGSTGSGPDATTGAPDETTTFGTGTATTTTEMTTTLTTTAEPGTTGDTSEVVDCDSIKADYTAELVKLRSCDDAKQCGQELKGTSCGCTHNLVARLDADSSELYAILMLADEHGCELILAGTCDCPAAEGFVCSDGLCGWNYL